VSRDWREREFSQYGNLRSRRLGLLRLKKRDATCPVELVERKQPVGLGSFSPEDRGIKREAKGMALPGGRGAADGLVIAKLNSSIKTARWRD